MEKSHHLGMLGLIAGAIQLCINLFDQTIHLNLQLLFTLFLPLACLLTGVLLLLEKKALPPLGAMTVLYFLMALYILAILLRFFVQSSTTESVLAALFSSFRLLVTCMLGIFVIAALLLLAYAGLSFLRGQKSVPLAQYAAAANVVFGVVSLFYSACGLLYLGYAVWFFKQRCKWKLEHARMDTENVVETTGVVND